MNPLFRAFAQLAKDEARRVFQSSTTGQIVRQIERIGRSGGSNTPEIVRLTKTLVDQVREGNVGRALRGTQAGRAFGEIERYASRGVKETLLDTMFSALGPLGDVFRSMLRPRRTPLAGIEAEIRAAHNLLKAFRPGLLAGQAGRPRPAVGGVSGTLAGGKDVQAARELLESLGFKVTPPPAARAPSAPTGPARPLAPQAPARGPAQRREYPADSPVMTGEMVRVDSSNVHSIGFLYDHDNPKESTLKVRFWQSSQSGKGRKVPGPMYYYYRVPPDLFDRFLSAASKGKWVWDHLRMRGSVSGHRFQYELKGISEGYVPRKATAYGHFGPTMREYFIRRRVKVQSTGGRDLGYMESVLPDQAVGSNVNPRSRSTYARPLNPRGRR